MANDSKRIVDDILSEVESMLEDEGIEAEVKHIGSLDLPKAVAADGSEMITFEFVIHANGILGRSRDDPEGYQIEVTGMYQFQVKSIDDAIALAQNYIPHGILRKENMDNLVWKPHPDRPVSLALFREDGTRSWDIFLTVEGLEGAVLRAVEDHERQEGGESNGESNGESDQSESSD